MSSSLIFELDGYEPRIEETVFVAPNAAIVGNVSIGAESSVWFGAAMRGDNGDNPITIGARTSIQDGVVIHVSTHRGTVIGDDVTVGHCAVLEGCTVHDRAVIGMNAVVLEAAEIGEGAMVAAGCVVPAGMVVPPRMLVAGVPAVIKKKISGASAGWIEHSAAHYVELARRYRGQLPKRS
jgi:carbonic anhydrase/acetyltransferase-like protein (isoleucine patch superfamily)